MKDEPKSDNTCPACWGSGWETQFITPCQVCGGDGKCRTIQTSNTLNLKNEVGNSAANTEVTSVEKLANIIDGLKEENELIIALEDSLKPKYENDVFTWHQIKNAILKSEVLNGAANTESDLKALLKECAVRAQIIMPTTEEEVRWFDDEQFDVTKSDFIIRLCHTLRIGKL